MRMRMIMVNHCMRGLCLWGMLAMILASAELAAQQTPRVANPGPGINVQVPPPPADTPKPEQSPQQTPASTPAPPPAAPGVPPTPSAPVAPPAPGATPAPAQPPKSGAAPSDSPLTSVNPPLPNAITERAANAIGEDEALPTPEEIPEEASLAEVVIDTLYVKGRTLEQVADEINKKSGAVVRIMENAAGQKVDLRARQKTVRQVLDEIVVGKDLTWIRRADGTYEIWDKPSFIEKELRKRVIRRVFPLRFVSVTDVQTAVEGVKSDVGAIAANPRTNELIVTDLPDKVALIESLLREIDVQLYTRAFKIKHANFDELQGRLPDLKSPAGMIQVDAINRIILVTDTFEKIKQMEQIIELLDIELPMKVYHLNSLGIEGEDALALVEDIITPLATEDALIQYNETQSALLVRDVAEVHDRILEVLKFMDRTPKQIWIEGEVLQVSRDYKFDLGTDVTYSPDLIGSVANGLLPSFLSTPLETNFGDNVFPTVTSGSGGLKVMNLTGNLKVTLDALMSDDKTRILLQPRALVRNNEEVAINITQENPQGTTFQNTGFNNNTNGLNGFIGSSIINVVTGLTLVLLPSINNRGLIEMELDFENSTPQERTIQIAGQPNTAIARNSQRIQTILIIPSGETRVLGGLISRSNGSGRSGIPYLSRIPWIGWVFGRRTETENERNLLFFLTPTIVEEHPQIEVVDLSINSAARAMTKADPEPLIEIPAGPSDINPIPEELMPYLRQAHPSVEGDVPLDDRGGMMITPQTDGGTTGPMSSIIEPAPAFEVVSDMLREDPSGVLASAYEPLPFTGPGAEMFAVSKPVTGVIGTSAGAGTKSPAGGRGGRVGAVARNAAQTGAPSSAQPAANVRQRIPPVPSTQPAAASPAIPAPITINPIPVRNETQ